ncbi:uroporphyrinogen decarboxylase family protein [Sinorhizobium meliloti]|nr:uroporphyrinogen decarboxylase family protein [Sinorhizobium meliloti]
MRPRAPPSAKIIAFAKGAGLLLKNYRQATGADAIGLDWSVPLAFAAELQKDGPVQGNLDPVRVVAGGAAQEHGTDRILDVLGQGAADLQSRPRHNAGRRSGSRCRTRRPRSRIAMKGQR